MLVLDYLASTLGPRLPARFLRPGPDPDEERGGGGAASGCMYALFFLVYIEPSVFTFGGEFISPHNGGQVRREVSLLPVSLAFAFAFVESRAPRYLVAFAFTCWSVMTTHPVGLAIIGLCVAGFDLVHVALNWRRREAWTTMVALAVALWSVVLVPALYVLGTGTR